MNVDFFSPQAAVWWQVAISALAAIATVAAVWAAVSTSRHAVRTALAISQRDAEEREKLRRVRAKALAAAFTEELWENGSRSHALLNHARGFPPSKNLAEFLVDLQRQMCAPVLEDALTQLDVFAAEEAELFARCATRIIQLRRSAIANERNNKLGQYDVTVQNVIGATSKIPALLDEGLKKAHEISGVPVTKIPPSENGALGTGTITQGLQASTRGGQ